MSSEHDSNKLSEVATSQNYNVGIACIHVKLFDRSHWLQYFCAVGSITGRISRSNTKSRIDA